MPISKNRRKNKKKPLSAVKKEKEALALPPIPDRRALESTMAQLTGRLFAGDWEGADDPVSRAQDLGERDDAVAHMWDMLRLNPSDNQGLAAMNKMVLTPALEKADSAAPEKMRRSIKFEYGAMVLIIGAAVSLTLVTPPRATGDMASGAGMAMGGGFQTTLERGKYTADFSIDPGSTGSNMVMITFKDDQGNPVEIVDVNIVWSLPSAGLEGIEGRGEMVTPRMFHFMFDQLIIPGEWEARVDAFVDDFDKQIFRTTVPIRYVGHGIVIIAVYVIYALIFLFLTLAVSANVRSAQATLVAMVGFWAVSSFVIPRAASDVSRLLYPTPTAVSFQANIEEALQSGLDGVSPDTVVQQRQEQTLSLYNVEIVEDLPINFQGMIFDLQEKLGNEVFDKFYGDLHRIFDQQTSLHQAFSVGSPRMAVQLASMELSGTSLNHHLEFTRQAEAYRRELIEEMNRDITFNSEAGQADYRAGPELWASVPRFEYEPPSLGALLARLGPSFMVMFLWLALSIVAGVIATRKMKAMVG